MLPNDPQTSGGLLMAVASVRLAALLNAHCRRNVAAVEGGLVEEESSLHVSSQTPAGGKDVPGAP